MRPDLRSVLELEREAVRRGEKSFDDFGLQRAYSVLELKTVVDNGIDQRMMEGIATTPTTDRMGDIVESSGAVFQVPFPLLWQHDSKQPVGWVTFAKALKEGIPYKAQWADAGIADFIDNAWKLVKAKLVRAVSIGFRPLEWKWIDEEDFTNLGIHFLKWEWMELSAVTIPANMDATISNIKSLDHFRTASRLAAHGIPPANVVRSSVVRTNVVTPAEVRGAAQPTQPKGTGTMKTNAEQIASYEAKRAANLARISELMGKSSDDGATLSTAEAEEYETLKGEMTSIDSHIKRLKEYSKMMLGAAEPVDVKANGGGGARGDDGLGAHGTPASSNQPVRSNDDGRVRGMRQNDNLAKGTAFVRYVMLLARSKGNHMQAMEWAREFDSSTPQVRQAFEAYVRMGMVQRAPVAPGTTTDPTWAGPLVQLQPMASEFIEYLYPMTILGRIDGFRRVPFNIKMPRQTSSGTAQWVGQGAAKPVGKIDFDLVSLGFAKVASIIVLTKDLVKFSSPSAEAVCRTDMAEAISQFLDISFIDPSVAAVPNVSPASVTHNAVKVPSSGNDIESIVSDVNEIFAEFSDNNVSPMGAYWVMNPRTAQAIGTLRTALGVFSYPTISIAGGTFMGLPVITSNNVKISPDTSRHAYAVLLKPSEILLADDGGVNVDLSEEASLEMSSTPTGGAQQLVSLWQQNLVGIRAEQYINWEPRRPHVVVVWDDLHF